MEFSKYKLVDMSQILICRVHYDNSDPGILGRTNLETKVQKIGSRNKSSGACTRCRSKSKSRSRVGVGVEVRAVGVGVGFLV